ncbi:hypothetical protein N9937_00370 [bacterium]|nr:hypothetical protein [bacterium]
MLMSRKVMKTQSGITSILDPNHPKVIARYPSTVATSTSWPDVGPNGYDFTVVSGTISPQADGVIRNNAVVRNSHPFLDGLEDFEILLYGRWSGDAGGIMDYYYNANSETGVAGPFFFQTYSNAQKRFRMRKTPIGSVTKTMAPTPLIVGGVSFRRVGQVVTLDFGGYVTTYDDPSMLGVMPTNTGDWELFSIGGGGAPAGSAVQIADMVFLNEPATDEERAEWYNDWVAYAP